MIFIRHDPATVTQDYSAQLPLALGQTEAFSFARFLPGVNSEVVQRLQSLEAMQTLTWTPIYLWGMSGTGKSHILQALCRALSDSGRHSVYLPLRYKQEFSPSILEGLESLPFVCLDDIDQIQEDNEWEQAVFNLFNRIRDQEQVLVMAAGVAPAQIRFKLSDLTSRLHSCLIYQLKDLDDATKLAVLKDKANARGFAMPDEVATYLIKRLSRNMHDLIDVLDELDTATLVAKRKLTIPFVRELLEIRQA